MIWLLFLLVPAILAFPGKALAVSKVTFEPATVSVANGQNFEANIKIDTGTEVAASAFIVVSFDTSKLEYVSAIDAVPTGGSKLIQTGYLYSTDTTEIGSGKLIVKVASTASTQYDQTAIVGIVSKVTFKAKTTGSATLSFVCTAGVLSGDTSIVKISGSGATSSNVDLIDCSSNNSLAVAMGTGSSSSSTPTPTSALQATPTSSTLPQTGVMDYSYGLIIVAMVVLIGAGLAWRL